LRGYRLARTPRRRSEGSS